MALQPSVEDEPGLKGSVDFIVLSILTSVPI